MDEYRKLKTNHGMVKFFFIAVHQRVFANLYWDVAKRVTREYLDGEREYLA
jgi:hypothetical protein